MANMLLLGTHSVCWDETNKQTHTRAKREKKGKIIARESKETRKLQIEQITTTFYTDACTHMYRCMHTHTKKKTTKKNKFTPIKSASFFLT